MFTGDPNLPPGTTARDIDGPSCEQCGQHGSMCECREEHGDPRSYRERCAEERGEEKADMERDTP